MALNVAMTPASAQSPAQPDPPDPLTVSQKDIQIESRSYVSLGDPYLPYGAIGGLGAAVLLLGGFAYAGRMKIAVPYVLACGTAVTLLLNPEIVSERHQNLPTEVVVAVDKSASQSTVPGRAETTAAMEAEIAKALEGLGGNVNVRIVDVGSSAGAEGTEIFTALKALPDLDPRNVGAVIVLTDGQVGDVPSSLSFPRGTPVHALISGKEGEKDRVLRILNAPPYDDVGKEQTITVIAEDVGAGTSPGQPVRLTVKGEGEEIQTIEAVTGEPAEIKVRLNHAGSNVISVEAEGLPGEVSEANNRVVASVRGIQKAVNVLMVSGTVNAGTPPLRHIFKSDPNSNMAHIIALRTPLDFDDTPSGELNLIPFPTRQIMSDLHKIDLVVFDHYPDLNLIPRHSLAVISNYVHKGGAVLVLAGPDFVGPKSLARTPLSSILPVKPTGRIVDEEAVPRASAEGQRHPVLDGLPGINALPGQEPGWGPWVDAIEVTKEHGTSILETPDGKPLLVLDRLGKGRVAVLLSDSLPLWNIGYKGGGPYEDLLMRVSHWLMKNPHLEEEALRLTPLQNSGKLIIERRTMGESAEPVTIITPAGEEVAVPLTEKSPGLWSAEIEADQTGIYQARQDGGQTLVSYAQMGPAHARELERLVSTDERLKALADRTGGLAQRMQDASGKLSSLSAEFARDGEPARNGRLTVRENERTVLKGREATSLLEESPYNVLAALLIAGLVAWGWVRSGDPGRVRRSMDTIRNALGVGKSSNGPQGPEPGV